MEAVGQLTGGLAHDFNNLLPPAKNAYENAAEGGRPRVENRYRHKDGSVLAGISGSLELMQIRVRQGRYGDVERYVGAAQGASARAAALTHRLLAFPIDPAEAAATSAFSASWRTNRARRRMPEVGGLEALGRVM